MKKRSWLATFVTLSSFVVINSEGLGVNLQLTDSQVEVLTSMQTALVEEIAVGYLDEGKEHNPEELPPYATTIQSTT